MTTPKTLNEKSKKPRKGLVKQVADVHRESSEFEEIEANQIKISSGNIESRLILYVYNNELTLEITSVD